MTGEAVEIASKNAKVLVVDDEENFRVLLRYVLEDAGYGVRTADGGREGLRAFFEWRPDLVVLDITMPEMDGWSVLERIRELAPTPVLILSARGHEGDRVRGLRGGADDYLVKPFPNRALLARGEAILRRTATLGAEEPRGMYVDGRVQVDFQRRRVFVDGRELKLSPLEFRLLSALVRDADVVLSPARLLDLCWGEKPGGPVNVRVYIGYLRRKLEDDPTKPKLIETVREAGYRYCPPREGA